MLLRSTLLAAALAALSRRARRRPRRRAHPRPAQALLRRGQRDRSASTSRSAGTTSRRSPRRHLRRRRSPADAASADAAAGRLRRRLAGSRARAVHRRRAARPSRCALTEHDGTGEHRRPRPRRSRALSVGRRPRRRPPSDRVRFRGRGFTDLTQPIYMHYVFAGKLQARRSGSACPRRLRALLGRTEAVPVQEEPAAWASGRSSSTSRPSYDPKASPRVPLTVKVAAQDQAETGSGSLAAGPLEAQVAVLGVDPDPGRRRRTRP